MKDKQTLFDITTNILTRIKEVLEKEHPDVVLVHGDTSTTFVTALACFYLQIPVGHESERRVCNAENKSGSRAHRARYGQHRAITRRTAEAGADVSVRQRLELE